MAGRANRTADSPQETGPTVSEQREPVDWAPMTEEQLRASTVGELTPLLWRHRDRRVQPRVAQLFAREAERVRAALGSACS